MIKRDSSLDIIRIVAGFSVIGIHFFLGTGYYSENIVGVRMYFSTIIRILFTVCVPLFMLLTGYLMKNKKLDRKYYSGINKVIYVYVLSSIFTYLISNIYAGNPISLKGLIFGILSFRAASYSWYINMYIGIFMLIPFLNKLYNSLSKLEKKYLILSLLILTSLPLFFNSHNYESLSWFISPSRDVSFNKILPDYWVGLFPLTYYFIGSFLSDYEINVKTLNVLMVYIISFVTFSVYVIFRAQSGPYLDSYFQTWGSLPVVIMSTSLFILLNRINTSSFSIKIKRKLIVVSNAMLGTYLVSQAFDLLIYGYLNELIPTYHSRVMYMFITVPIIFIFSLIISLIINKIIEVLERSSDLIKLNSDKNRSVE